MVKVAHFTMSVILNTFVWYYQNDKNLFFLHRNNIFSELCQFKERGPLNMNHRVFGIFEV